MHLIIKKNYLNLISGQSNFNKDNRSFKNLTWHVSDFSIKNKMLSEMTVFYNVEHKNLL